MSQLTQLCKKLEQQWQPNMKRIVLLLSCVLFSTQLLVAHTHYLGSCESSSGSCALGTGYSWAECDGCVKNAPQNRSAKSSFEYEWDRDGNGQEDNSEQVFEV